MELANLMIYLPFGGSIGLLLGGLFGLVDWLFLPAFDLTVSNITICP